MARPVLERPDAVSPWPFVGMGLVAADLFLYGAAGLVAPWWAVLVLLVVWVLCFVQSCLWWTTHPRRITVLAAAMAVGWFVFLVVGAALFEWQA